MLAACLEDGLTVGNQVFKKGDIFVLGGEVAGDLENVSEERLARKQTRIYGKPMYRKATPEEIIQVVLYSPRKISTDSLTSPEKALVARYAQGRKAKEAEARTYLVKEKDKLEKEDAFIDEAADGVEVPVEDAEDITEEEAGNSEVMDKLREGVSAELSEKVSVPKKSTRRKSPKKGSSTSRKTT